MNTAITITLIIAAVVVVNIITTGLREIVTDKRTAGRCPSCGHDLSKESEA